MSLENFPSTQNALLDAAPRFIAAHAPWLLALGIVLISLCVTGLWLLFLRYGEGGWRRIETLLGERLKPSAYLIVHLTLGFGLVLLSAGLFLGLADEIGEDEDLRRFDHHLADALRDSLSQATLQAASVITHLGDRAVLVGIGVVIALVLLARRRWTLASGWIVATLGNSVLVYTLKHWFRRERPLHDHHGLLIADGFSFPSGHAAGSLAVYGMLAYLLLRVLTPVWRLPMVLGAVTLVLLIGASRVLLQVHFFSDVVAGYAVAAGWLAVCVPGTELVVRRTPRSP